MNKKIINIGEYKGNTPLIKSLTYMKQEYYYILTFGKLVKIHLKYNDKKKYLIYIEILNKTINVGNLRLSYGPINTKVLFISRLKKIIDKLLPILYKKGYKNVEAKPEVSLFDLENISSEFNLENKEITLNKIEQGKEESLILNSVLIFHNILKKESSISKIKKNEFIISINSLDLKDLILFPIEDKNLTNIKLELKGTPNLYFPGIININIVKSFSYKNYKFKIIYDSTNIISYFASITKQYYEYYKLKVNEFKKVDSDKILEFTTKLFSILKNPYHKNFLKENDKLDLIGKSNCPKCGSSSSMFKVTFSNVLIKNKISAFNTNELYAENVLNYKDIIIIKCIECNNEIFVNKNKLEEIEEKRKYLLTEKWIHPIKKVPLLDLQEETSVLLKYDLLEMEVEFDLTNPLNPKLDYSKITNVGKVIEWTHQETGITTNFFSN